ncbi:hypothetical protein JOB18_012687 [Solea senegalensis]|uniref:Protein FAM117B n=1 Tax=Solea senegalensis TaxID=28829 RepID=A0AAV6RDD4_SOLSE|nr:hypothetical protein JOB18_012687 [Solea senegalensis]
MAMSQSRHTRETFPVTRLFFSLLSTFCSTRPSNCSISTRHAALLHYVTASLRLRQVSENRERKHPSIHEDEGEAGCANTATPIPTPTASMKPFHYPSSCSGKHQQGPGCSGAPRSLVCITFPQTTPVALTHHTSLWFSSVTCVSHHRVQLWPSQGALAGSHLTGPWPQDDSQHQHVPYMRDKATQTPRAWADERRRGSHKRSASCGSTDQLKEIAKLRQQLQRSKRSSRHRRDKDRKSPFNGSHTIIQSQSSMPKTILIPIPISKSSAPRFRNSVEGLNQEIERIIIRDTPEKEETIVPQDVPDGHRAPPPVPPQRSSSTRSINTQTPSGGGLSGNHSNCSSRPDSISPSYLTILNDAGGGGSPYEDKELGPCSPLPKYAASPRPNNSYMFKREPPEGCEKVKAFEESMPKPLQDIPPFLCPDRNKVNFIPNSGSAFCLVSILKPLLPAPELSFRPGVGLRSLSPSLVPLSTQPCLLEEPESF